MHYDDTIISFEAGTDMRDLVVGEGKGEALLDHPLDQQVFHIRMANSEGRREAASLLLKKMYGWRGTASEKVELAMFQANGTQCGSTTEINSSNTTWQQTNLSGDETGCSVSANDVVTFRIRLTASASGYARASNLQINYLSQF